MLSLSALWRVRHALLHGSTSFSSVLQLAKPPFARDKAHLKIDRTRQKNGLEKMLVRACSEPWQFGIGHWTAPSTSWKFARNSSRAALGGRQPKEKRQAAERGNDGHQAVLRSRIRQRLPGASADQSEATKRLSSSSSSLLLIVVTLFLSPPHTYTHLSKMVFAHIVARSTFGAVRIDRQTSPPPTPASAFFDASTTSPA